MEFLADDQLWLRVGLLDALHQRGALPLVKRVHIARLKACEERQGSRLPKQRRHGVADPLCERSTRRVHITHDKAEGVRERLNSRRFVRRDYAPTNWVNVPAATWRQESGRDGLRWLVPVHPAIDGRIGMPVLVAFGANLVRQVVFVVLEELVDTGAVIFGHGRDRIHHTCLDFCLRITEQIPDGPAECPRAVVQAIGNGLETDPSVPGVVLRRNQEIPLSRLRATHCVSRQHCAVDVTVSRRLQ